MGVRKIIMLLLCVIGFSAAVKKNATGCSGAADCNYNGQCQTDTSRCQCDHAWTGDACDVLTLQTLSRSDRLGYQGGQGDKLLASWGGSVLIDDDGKYHMYASEITSHCGMNVWLSNSQVIHATSNDPLSEPFEKQGVVSGVFSHEPIAARAPSGEFVVYFTAVLPPLAVPVIGGQRCKQCTNGTSPKVCGTDDNRNATTNLPTYMVYSQHPDGPWSKPEMIPGTDQFADSNFAPVINDDGSVVGLMRGAVIAATNWKDVTTYHQVGSWDDAGEDPFVWKDFRYKNVYHNIVHVGRENTHGLHYYSTDGINWVKSPGNGFAYTNTVAFDDGSSDIFGCRERPHLVFDSDGKVIALTNGAAPVTCHTAGGNDYAYTLLQPVAL